MLTIGFTDENAWGLSEKIKIANTVFIHFLLYTDQNVVTKKQKVDVKKLLPFLYTLIMLK